MGILLIKMPCNMQEVLGVSSLSNNAYQHGLHRDRRPRIVRGLNIQRIRSSELTELHMRTDMLTAGDYAGRLAFKVIYHAFKYK